VTLYIETRSGTEQVLNLFIWRSKCDLHYGGASVTLYSTLKHVPARNKF
jgi:hypothetical protein